MLIRFEISDKEGQSFKEKCKEKGLTMSQYIRINIRKFLKENNNEKLDAK